MTLDDPVTGQRVPLENLLGSRPDPTCTLPPAALLALQEDPRLTREQAAAYLGVSPATLAEWASRKRGPAYYDYGQGSAYPLSELRQWQASQLVRPTQPAPDAPPRAPGRPRRVPLK